MSGWVRAAAAAAAALGLVLALAIGLRGGGRDDDDPAPGRRLVLVRATPATTAPALEEFLLMPIRVRGAKPVGGVQRMTVKRGANVSIGVDSDAYDRVVLAGYDLQAVVEPFRETVLSFTAGTVGSFDVELANAHILIGRITVVAGLP